MDLNLLTVAQLEFVTGGFKAIRQLDSARLSSAQLTSASHAE